MGWWWPAVSPHGGVSVVHRAGDVPDGGGSFESEYLYLFLMREGRVAYVELYEMDALERALARFRELCP